MFDVPGAVDKLVVSVLESAQTQREALLMLKQATVRLNTHFDSVRLQAADEQRQDDAQQALTDLRAFARTEEQKASAALKMSRSRVSEVSAPPETYKPGSDDEV